MDACKFKEGDRVISKSTNEVGTVQQVCKSISGTHWLVKVDFDGMDIFKKEESLVGVNPRSVHARAPKVPPKQPALPQKPKFTTAECEFLGIDEDGVFRLPGQDKDGKINGGWL